MDSEDEEFAHGAKRTTVVSARKTAPDRRIPSYCEFATHRIEESRWRVACQTDDQYNIDKRLARIVNTMASLPTVASVLGGQARLHARPRSAHDWHELIRRGLPVAAMDAFKQQAMLADAELAQLIGVSEKTLSRARAGHAKLDAIASDRLYRVVRLVVLATEVLESPQAALRWLKRAQVGLGSATPLEMMTTDAGSAEVEKLLLRIEHGVYS